MRTRPVRWSRSWIAALLLAGACGPDAAPPRLEASLVPTGVGDLPARVALIRGAVDRAHLLRVALLGERSTRTYEAGPGITLLVAFDPVPDRGDLDDVLDGAALLDDPQDGLARVSARDASAVRPAVSDRARRHRCGHCR